MNWEDLTSLSDEALLQKAKKIKSNKILGAVLIGATIGIVIYGTVKSGFGFFTFVPLVLTYIFYKNSKKNESAEKEVQNELKSRNLHYKS